MPAVGCRRCLGCHAQRSPDTGATSIGVAGLRLGRFLGGAAGVLDDGSRQAPLAQARAPRVAGPDVCLFVALDTVFESLLVWLHVQAYTGVIHGLSLWEGTDHQLPLYEIAFGRCSGPA